MNLIGLIVKFRSLNIKHVNGNFSVWPQRKKTQTRCAQCYIFRFLNSKVHFWGLPFKIKLKMKSKTSCAFVRLGNVPQLMYKINVNYLKKYWGDILPEKLFPRSPRGLIIMCYINQKLLWLKYWEKKRKLGSTYKQIQAGLLRWRLWWINILLHCVTLLYLYNNFLLCGLNSDSNPISVCFKLKTHKMFPLFLLPVLSFSSFNFGMPVKEVSFVCFSHSVILHLFGSVCTTMITLHKRGQKSFFCLIV